MIKKILIGATILGLFGTMTNLIYVSPLPTLIAAFLFPLVYVNRQYIPRPVFWLLLFTLFTVVSTALYSPGAFLEYGFYRYDGNFFISYLPLLVLPFFAYRFDIGKLLKLFLLSSTAINSVVYAIYSLSGQTTFSGLFLSTNGAGGFYSIVTSLALLFFWYRKTYTNLLILLLNLLFLYATYSRGSMLGLGLGFVCLFFLNHNKVSLIRLAFVAVIIVQVVILFFSYPDYKKYVFNGPTENIYENYNLFANQEFGPRSTKLNNVYTRMYETWPRAVDNFLHSPLVGTGFGSVNDVPVEFKSVIPYLVQTNGQEEKVYNDSHAHHSFLHILGEQGIVGLGLFLIFWFSIYKYLLNNNYHPIVRDFLLISYFNLSIMSFTEHRITTPSNALPFVIVLGLYFVYVNYQKREQQLATAE